MFVSEGNEQVALLRRFVADGDADLAGCGGERRSGRFSVAYWHELTPAQVGQAAALLSPGEYRRFLLHYMRRTGGFPPPVEDRSLNCLLDAYRDFLSLVPNGSHGPVFVFGFDDRGNLPGVLHSAELLKARLALLKHICTFDDLSRMRQRVDGFSLFLSQSNHVLDVLRHLGYRHEDDECATAYHPEPVFWGLIQVALLSPATRSAVLSDLLDGHHDLPDRDRVLAHLHRFTLVALRQGGGEDAEYVRLVSRLAERERNRTGGNEAAMLAARLKWPLEEGEPWSVSIQAPLEGRPSWYHRPDLDLFFQPDPDHGWLLRIETETCKLSQQNGRLMENHGGLEPLATLADFPAWLARIGDSHGLRFDLARSRIYWRRNRSNGKLVAKWIAGKT